MNKQEFIEYLLLKISLKINRLFLTDSDASTISIGDPIGNNLYLYIVSKNGQILYNGDADIEFIINRLKYPVETL